VALRSLKIARPDEELTFVDHLEELRGRLFVCLGALVVAFGLCFWQSDLILRVINHPLTVQTAKQVREGKGPLGETAVTERAVRELALQTADLAQLLAEQDSGLSAKLRAQLSAQATTIEGTVQRLPRTAQGDKPITIGVGEPFTATFTVALYFSVLLALPVILFELYGFVIPAFTPKERRLALPLMWAAPLLFVAGVLFGYFVVLPAAVDFLQNFNSSQFNVMVQADQYYRFVATTLLAVGLSFELPVAVVALVASGAITSSWLRRRRRYAIVLCAVIAALLPGEAVTMVLEGVPLYLLFELSVACAWLIERQRKKRALALEAVGP